jgi:hypothetical protein
MSEKKLYRPPELYRVELNQEQAILSQCSLMATNPMAGGLDLYCRRGGCKRSAAPGQSDGTQRPS